MKIGDSRQVIRCYTEAEITAYHQLAQTPGAPATTTVPEPLIGGLFSYLLGEKLPGFGTNYLKQSLAFHQVAPVGEPLCAEVTVERIRADKHLVDLATRCSTAAGVPICSGRALVLVKDVT